MRKFLISVAVIAFSAFPALAQHDHDHGPGGGGAPAAQPHGGGPAPQAPHGGPPAGGAPGGGHFDHGGGAPGGGHFDRGGGAPHPEPNAAFNRGPNGGNPGRPAMTTNPAFSRGANGGGFERHAEPNPAYTRGPNGGFNRGGSNRPEPGAAPGGNRGGQAFNRGSGGRHDFHGFVDFHQNVTAQRHFHAGAYNRPSGWYPHHWVFGETLPALFWGRNYWLMDYVDYALPPPPYGAVWVRYGNDALLIDQDSGEIITVEYGVFY